MTAAPDTLSAGKADGFVGLTRHGSAFISVADIQRELRGKSLACWCRLGTPCHADVLIDLANAETQKEGA